MEISEGKLQSVLYEKRVHIKSHETFVSTASALLCYVAALWVTDFQGMSVRRIIVLSVISAAYLAVLAYSVQGANYSVDRLYRDICSTSGIHGFSLLIIKNSRGQYLLKKDRRWKTCLFPYKRTKADDDAADALAFLREAIGITDAKITEKKETEITKRSVSQDISKSYHHTFYKVSAACLHEKPFKVNGIRYVWLSMDDMKENRDLMRKNAETVEFVEANF